ncbi:MAG TPA: aminotransferase class I/II-fold pyridoxal phosphate-dependent enzyme [Candidatus Limnocylindria bacterium]|nr:aminotransferase class I/II-fold pyridoxal phosphate-dependent enzyme [Candidatus Limnocylindria bacterium]
MTTTSARHIDQLRDSIQGFIDFFEGPFSKLNENPEVSNFAVGNPLEAPMTEYIDTLRTHLEPRRRNWFAYKVSEPKARIAVARSLSASTGMEWDPEDVAMTNGGFAALAVAMRALAEPGDEVIFLSPPWFFYEFQILASGATPIRAHLAPPAFEPDFDEIAAAITPRTRAIIFNSPQNPSGRVYPLETLARLAQVLTDASERIGHPIYLISDEPYRRILFDGIAYHSPAEVYPYTVVTYSYGKQLLAPGQRVGYLTVPPTMPDREAFRETVFVAQFATGYAWPNALLQHALPDLEPLLIDMPAMQRRRDRLIEALREIGYESTMPEGTFYAMVRSPIDDDVAFTDILAKHRVLVLPGSIVEVPGWFRISLTATDDMVEPGIAGFAAAYAEATSA